MNDPPVNTVPAAQSTPGNTPLIFSAGNGNAISIADVDAASGSLQVTLGVTSGTLALGSTNGLSVSGNGTATIVAGGTLADLNAALQTLSFTPASGFAGTVTLTVTTNDQGNTGSGGAVQDTDTVTITVGTLPSLSINDVTVQEGNSGTTNATFTLTLSPASNLPVTVQAQTADGTAHAPVDYTATGPTTLTITPGQPSATFSVPISGDTLFEPDETFVVNLTNPQNATISKAQATSTIKNDDVPGDVVAITIDDVRVTEGNSGTTAATFTVALNRVSRDPVTVQYATSDGTATVADGDYQAASGTLTFNAGDLSKTLTVTVTGDTKVEPDEAFTMTLSTPANAALAKSQGIAVIVNDDTAVATACSPRPPVAVATRANWRWPPPGHARGRHGRSERRQSPDRATVWSEHQRPDRHRWPDRWSRGVHGDAERYPDEPDVLRAPRDVRPSHDRATHHRG